MHVKRISILISSTSDDSAGCSAVKLAPEAVRRLSTVASCGVDMLSVRIISLHSTRKHTGKSTRRDKFRVSINSRTG